MDSPMLRGIQLSPTGLGLFHTILPRCDVAGKSPHAAVVGTASATALQSSSGGEVGCSGTTVKRHTTKNA